MFSVFYLSGGSKGKGRAPLPTLCPNSFIFMQFRATILQSNRLAYTPWELAPPWEIPGSATVSVGHTL